MGEAPGELARLTGLLNELGRAEIRMGEIRRSLAERNLLRTRLADAETASTHRNRASEALDAGLRDAHDRPDAVRARIDALRKERGDDHAVRVVEDKLRSVSPPLQRLISAERAMIPQSEAQTMAARVVNLDRELAGTRSGGEPSIRHLQRQIVELCDKIPPALLQTLSGAHQQLVREIIGQLAVQDRSLSR